MAWNEPGNGKDPWRRDDQEPNDLDKIVQSWQGRLGGLLGGGKPGAGGGSGYFVLIFAIVAWGITGFYRVDEAERGVVQRFGAYTETTLPGLRWHLPYPIERVDRVNTIEIQEKSYNREMLTADEQYVSVDMVVQYRREDPMNYSFKVEDPDATVGDVTESALREVVGTTALETLVSGRREEIASRTMEVLQSTLDSYETGIRVTSVNLRDVKYPQNVQAAVDDAQKARNDSERYFREAETYANDILPKARGDAARMLEDARAYRDRVIANAEGEAARFEALLAEYEKAPEVTRERLYIEALEEVYGNTNKVILDSEGSGNLLYLPIDKLIENRAPGYVPALPREQDLNSQQQDARAETNPRDRRTRQ